MHCAGQGDVDSMMLRHIHYHCPAKSIRNAPPQLPPFGHELLQKVASKRISRWVRGINHPPGLKGLVVPESAYNNELAFDPLFRAKMLLRFATGLEVFPLQNWSIKV
jgi:hypothetical protein